MTDMNVAVMIGRSRPDGRPGSPASQSMSVAAHAITAIRPNAGIMRRVYARAGAAAERPSNVTIS